MFIGRLAAISILLAVAIIAAPALALDPGENAPVFDLEDQFDKPWSLTALKGNVVVLIAATPKSGEAMDPWVSSLNEKYGTGIKLVGMMDLHRLPGIIRSVAKSRIKKETQQPLMLDFSGSASKAYGANDKNPVVVVIDKDSKVQAVAGSHSEEGLASVTTVIDKLLGARSD